MNHREEIDGLRALAVIAVILFHAGFDLFSGGFVGVDVFFVISGYLITSIIILEKNNNTFSLLRFYERRARRILPALFLMMFVCIPLAWWWLLPSDMHVFSQSLAAQSIFVSNIFFWNTTGYFDTNTNLKPLLHTWSLAVEEQYYLLFPLALLLIWKISKHRLTLLLGITALISLGLAQWGALNKPVAAFFLLPTRAWELLIGALTAIYLLNNKQATYNRLLYQTVSLSGLMLIFVAVLTFNHNTPFPGLYALVPTLGTALIILFAHPQTVTGKLLSSKPLVGIGLISYSAYLWHQPLFAFARYKTLAEPNIIVFISLIFTIIALAYCSWRYVEQPFRNKYTIGKTKILIFSIVGTLLFFTVGLAGHFSNGYEESFVTKLSTREQGLYKSLQRSTENQDSECQFYSTHISDVTIAHFHACYKKHGPAIIITGDSHAINLFWAIKFNSKYPFIWGIAQGGCRAHTHNANCQYNQLKQLAATEREKIKRLIYTQAGFYLIQDKNGNVGNRTFFEKRAIPVYAPNQAPIKRVIEYLAELAQYTQVIWLGPRIEPHQNVVQLFKLARQCKTGQSQLHPNAIKTFVQLDQALEQILAPMSSQIEYISQLSIIKFDADTDLYDCDAVYWSDGDHLSVAGEKRFGKIIIDALSKQDLAPFTS